MTPAAPVPRLEPAFDVTATLGPLEDHGVTRAGHRRVVPITGGRVSGLVDAEILAGGADWQIVRPDGSTEIGRSSSPPRSAGPTACATRPTGSPERGSRRRRSGRLKASGGEHAAQVDNGLGVDVLALRLLEERLLGSDGHVELAVVAGRDGADGLKQRDDRVPLDVVAHRVVEDLPKGIAVTAAQVL
jgi:hypothetical protein